MCVCVLSVLFACVFACFVSAQDKPYEYVMVDSPSLASVSADGGAFATHIASGEGANICFIHATSYDMCLYTCTVYTQGILKQIYLVWTQHRHLLLLRPCFGEVIYIYVNH